MEKFIPYEKLSKKNQRELNAKKRGSWGNFNPVTRKPTPPKAYNRKTAQRWKDAFCFEPFYILIDFYTVTTCETISKSTKYYDIMQEATICVERDYEKPYTNMPI